MGGFRFLLVTETPHVRGFAQLTVIRTAKVPAKGVSTAVVSETVKLAIVVVGAAVNVIVRGFEKVSTQGVGNKRELGKVDPVTRDLDDDRSFRERCIVQVRHEGRDGIGGGGKKNWYGIFHCVVDIDR